MAKQGKVNSLEPVASFLKKAQVSSLYKEDEVLVLYEEMSLEQALRV
jgi:hypothetical protein